MKLPVPGQESGRNDGLEQLRQALAESGTTIRGRFSSEIAELGRKRYRSLVDEHLIGKGKPGRPRQKVIDKILGWYKKAGCRWTKRMFDRGILGFRDMELAEQKKARRQVQAAVRQRITQEKRRAPVEL